jgi:hypothetical protein
MRTIARRSTAVNLTSSIKQHYSGIRTIYRILSEIRRCAAWLDRLERSISTGDYLVLRKIIDEHSRELPLKARQKFLKSKEDGVSLGLNREQEIEKQFGDHRLDFIDEIFHGTRKFPCLICNRLRNRVQVCN